MKFTEGKASENKYLHRDFHISMNMLMQYICDEYGDKALTDYLIRFSSKFHSQRKECLMKGDLKCIKDYFTDIYAKEEWPVKIEIENDVLLISQQSCPGISYLKMKKQVPVKQYIETYTTVYKTMCEGTPYEYSIEGYNPKNGACVQRFQRRPL